MLPHIATLRGPQPGLPACALLPSYAVSPTLLGRPPHKHDRPPPLNELTQLRDGLWYDSCSSATLFCRVTVLPSGLLPHTTGVSESKPSRMGLLEASAASNSSDTQARAS